MIEIKYDTPDVESFLRLRQAVNLSPRSREGAEKGLPKSLFAITLYNEGKAIGMGRVVGDGGCNFEIVDIVVEPNFQGQGLGRRIMENIMNYINKNAPKDAYISLIADVPELYEKFGFKRCEPNSFGMFKRI